MLLTEAGCGLIAFILCISGIHAQTHICALCGSSVNLTCSTKNLTSRNTWFTEHRKGLELVYKELSADERHVIHTSDENQPTLTISSLTKSDANVYCCGNQTENPDPCWQHSVKLNVLDLQVTVSPVMLKQWENKVKLMCNTNCNLTESPASYIWYMNEKSLKEEKSFYYTNVSRHKKVTFSCGVKGYYKPGAPKVSLDLFNPNCLNVTYAEGVMCSSQNKLNNGSCSFTYPTDLQVTVIPVMSEKREYDVKLMCRTRCDLTESPAVYIWYMNKTTLKEQKSFFYPNISRHKKVTFSCAVKGYDNFRAPEVSLALSNRNFLKVTYAKGEMCPSQNNSDNGSCSFKYRIGPEDKNWKMKTDTAAAAAAGAGAAFLVVIPAIIFIWIRTKRALEQPSTTGEGDVTPQLSSSHVYENIPAQPPQHDDLNYSTISFQPKEREHCAYAVVCFRPDV